MATVTLKVYFRNIMLFVHDRCGTDAWFVANHAPRLITSTECLRIDGRVVTFTSNGSPLPEYETDVTGAGLIVDFGEILHGVQLHPELVQGRLGNTRPGRVELRGTKGALHGPPSLHSYGSLLDWTLPGTGITGVLTQRLTELATYEVPDLELPIVAVVTDPTGVQKQVQVEVPLTGQVAEIMFVAGEIPKAHGGVRIQGEMLHIEEFKELFTCFDADTEAELKRIEAIPRARKPKDLPSQPVDANNHRTGFRSASPYCPGGRVRRP